LGGGILGNPTKVEVSHNQKDVFKKEALRLPAEQEEV